MDLAIRADRLRKLYGSLVAVDGVTFDVRCGEAFGLLGPNGAGKTTTIRMLVGLSEPTEGSATVNGFDVVREKVQAKGSVGVVPELSNLYPELSSLDNLLYAAELYGVPKPERRERCTRLLEQFGLADRQNSRFQALSRGLKRRLTIAAALLHRPPLLFLDEPTTGLDVVSARNLRTIIRGLREEGTTILLTTHLIPEAEELCDRIALIVKGRIIAIDSPQGLKARLDPRPVLEVTVSGDPSARRAALERDPAIERVVAGESSLRLHVTSVADGLAALHRCTSADSPPVVGISTIAPTLEDAFVHLTGVESEIMMIDKPQKPGSG